MRAKLTIESHKRCATQKKPRKPSLSPDRLRTFFHRRRCHHAMAGTRSGTPALMSRASPVISVASARLRHGVQRPINGRSRRSCLLALVPCEIGKAAAYRSRLPVFSLLLKFFPALPFLFLSGHERRFSSCL